MIVVILAHMGTIGAKLLLALFAIDLGASPLQVGITFAMFSILPAILAISAGRWVDRIGVRLPLLLGCGCLALSIGIVFLTPALWALYLCAALIGVSFMVYVVAGQSIVGSMSASTDRTRNFSYYSLAVALAGRAVAVAVGGSSAVAAGTRAGQYSADPSSWSHCRQGCRYRSWRRS